MGNSTALEQSFSLLNRRGQAIITAACEQLDISYSEYVVLMRLLKDEGRSQDEVANFLVLDKAVITRTVNALEKKGLVRREKHLRDKRVKRLYPTDLAKALEVKLAAVLDNWFEYLFADFDEAKCEIIFKGIERATERASVLLPRKFLSMQNIRTPI